MEFVMVPGGWQGGWVFDAVADELRGDGHQVRAVTLAGLEADGPPDADRPPNLDTHIEQVAEIAGRAGAGPLVLCGHSYGAMVVAGVADRLVFIDACWVAVPDGADPRARPHPPTGSLQPLSNKCKPMELYDRGFTATARLPRRCRRRWC
ncbi:alpha/beta fold hydrolase [Streptomyces sp. MBT49]|uniref:alpha/beta fold hydrolase n=1 Tax=Streptomyces sp. MBT49 TaxID=1488380 RepID=UPI0027DDE015|nr:alpha/beta fold hydrolase [Streptomyces sp. MBT49]